MITTHNHIYKIDSKGKTRVWYMEQEGSKHRTVAGILGGKLVTSTWTQCEATNVGRSNERSPEQQATFEINALYEYNLSRDYHITIGGASNGAHFFEPMLAKKYEGFEPGFAQPKLDGVRCIAKADGLWSREGKPIVGVPHIINALAPIFESHPDTILDGELYSHDFKDDFNTIISAVRKQKPTQEDLISSEKIVQYHIYDTPSHPGLFQERFRQVLNFKMLVNSDMIVAVETCKINTEKEFDELHGKWLQDGYEGSMWRGNGPYEQKRSKYLRKRKEFLDEEFIVSRVIEGKGNYSGCAKSVEFIMPGDKRTETGERPKAGIKGSQGFLKQLLVDADKLIGAQVTITYFQLTPDGIPRFGVASKWHGNKREY